MATSVDLHILDHAVERAQSFRHAMAPTHAEFLEWARQNGVNERVVGFLDARGDYAGTSPAAWNRFGALLDDETFNGLSIQRKLVIARIALDEHALGEWTVWDPTGL